jgi:hypothetical protein
MHNADCLARFIGAIRDFLLASLGKDNMLISVKSLEGYTIRAKDGDIGKVVALYFEDRLWVVRYLVVKVGSWLDRHEVLIVPAAIERIDSTDGALETNLTREQVQNSPDVESHPSLAREKELALHRYYQWQPYWAQGPVGMADTGLFPVNPVGSIPLTPGAAGRGGFPREPAEEVDAIQRAIQEEENEGRVSLRSTSEIFGYAIEAEDESAGKVHDMLIEAEEWYVYYLVADTGSWLAGKKVLIEPGKVKSIRWSDATVFLAMTQAEVEHSPTYDPDNLDRPLIV